MEIYSVCFADNKLDAVKALAQELGYTLELVHWFNRATDNGQVAVIDAVDPLAYSKIYRAYKDGILLGYALGDATE